MESRPEDGNERLNHGGRRGGVREGGGWEGGGEGERDLEDTGAASGGEE